jgi:hypothetical protein
LPPAAAAAAACCSRGIAFITFTSQDAADSALQYDGEQLEGQTLKVGQLLLQQLTTAWLPSKSRFGTMHEGGKCWPACAVLLTALQLHAGQYL